MREPVPLHVLPPGLVTEAVEDGWTRLAPGLLAIDVQLQHPQTVRGVWLCARSGKSLDLIRPLGDVDEGDVPPRVRQQVKSSGSFERLGGVLAAVGFEARETAYRRLRSSAVFMAHLAATTFPPTDLTIESGWTPFATPATDRVGPWWEQSHETDW